MLVASDRIELRDGKLPAPGPQRCVRLHATGPFERATVLVNQVNAGELRNQDAELDITGYLSPGAPNSVEVRAAARVERIWAWLSPLVYIARARLLDKGLLEVTIANTTENTAQVEIGEHQFTVSPGTSSTRQIPWTTSQRRVHMRAVSDGLDREFIDDEEVSDRVTARRPSLHHGVCGCGQSASQQLQGFFASLGSTRWTANHFLHQSIRNPILAGLLGFAGGDLEGELHHQLIESRRLLHHEEVSGLFPQLEAQVGEVLLIERPPVVVLLLPSDHGKRR